jgi:hypothetical protein
VGSRSSSAPEEGGGVPFAEFAKTAALQGPFAVRCALDVDNPALHGADLELELVLSYACVEPRSRWSYIAQCPSVVDRQKWWLHCNGVLLLPAPVGSSGPR